MTDLKTLTVLKTPVKKKLLCWSLTTEDGEVFFVEGTAVAIHDENAGVSVYDGNDLVLHHQSVITVMLNDEERARKVPATPKVKAAKKASTAAPKKKKKVANA
jgi:hypothetical protein